MPHVLSASTLGRSSTLVLKFSSHTTTLRESMFLRQTWAAFVVLFLPTFFHRADGNAGTRTYDQFLSFYELSFFINRPRALHEQTIYFKPLNKFKYFMVRNQNL